MKSELRIVARLAALCQRKYEVFEECRQDGRGWHRFDEIVNQMKTLVWVLGEDESPMPICERPMNEANPPTGLPDEGLAGTVKGDSPDGQDGEKAGE